ncbi:hypothetical protein NEIMUCOT_03631 [Neisseria mucosa ATCC 25996]|uniref:Uncharacterized protein n=1 Tax=Neisseria mucosa (strain ATCC 25996 / DSM 4631 / NCTC 10774 / M26) TaxID=546266 RepID=D2ZSP9_NEIM2|nr:hypothetical protein NEIMUCOT_03631 [Neisseria mucosa ATCC 25996]
MISKKLLKFSLLFVCKAHATGFNQPYCNEHKRSSENRRPLTHKKPQV